MMIKAVITLVMASTQDMAVLPQEVGLALVIGRVEIKY